MLRLISAILLFVALLGAVIASEHARAQGVGVQVGPGGGVSIETDRDRRRGDRLDRRRERENCRTVTTRQQLPDGSTKTVREKRCR